MAASVPEETIEELKLGPRIRRARERTGLTIVEAAQRSGYSPGYISQVERDLANPSLGTLKRIASALGVALPSFFADPPRAPDGPAPARESTPAPLARVVRADRRKTLLYPGSNIRHQLLSADLRGKLEAIWASAPPGAGTGDEPYVHVGEEIGIVVKGRAECRVGQELYRLEAGDAITLPSEVPHSWRNAGDETLEIVWVSTPPTF